MEENSENAEAANVGGVLVGIFTALILLWASYFLFPKLASGSDSRQLALAVLMLFSTALISFMTGCFSAVQFDRYFDSKDKKRKIQEIADKAIKDNNLEATAYLKPSGLKPFVAFILGRIINLLITGLIAAAAIVILTKYIK